MGMFDDIPTAEAGGAAPEGGRSPTRIEVRPIDPRARDLVVKTVYGEAGQEPPEGQAAVAAVIRNRLQSGKYGPAVPNVVLAPNQFEPWNTQAGRNRMSSLKPDSPNYQAIGDIVDRIFSGDMADPTQGATHFYSPTAQAALGRQPPKWAQDQEPLNIGRHAFYAPEGRVGMSDVSAQSRHPANAASPTTVSMAPGSAPTPQQTSVAAGLFDDIPAKREQQGPPVPDIGRAAAAGVGLRAGGMFNLNDERAGLAAAGRDVLPQFVQEANPVSSAVLAPVIGGARLLYEKATGQGAGTAAYEQARDIERQQLATAREQYPGTTMAGELAGSVAAPIPGAAAVRGATGTVRALRSAGVGATAGALSGAGEGETIEGRALGAATGGAVGGVVGGVAVPVLAGVEKAAALAAKPLAMVRGAVNPEAEAARRVGSAIERDRAVGAGGLGDAEYAAAQAGGAPVAALDLGGATTRSLGRSAANTSPEGRAALERLTEDRFAGQSERVAEALTGLVRTPANAGVTRDALEAAAQTARKPFYDRAYKAGSGGIWDGDLERMAQTSPLFEKAMHDAVDSLRNKAAAGRAMGPLSASGKPTLEFWDQVKRGLDSEYNKLSRGGDLEGKADVDALRKALIGKLDATVPEYNVARGVSASFFKANDALNAGEKFVTDNFNLGAARKALGKMTPEERDLFAEGFVSKYKERLLSIGDNRNVLNQIANTPTARAKIDMVLGQNGTEKVEAALRVERIMDQGRGMLGNSSTARQLIEAGLAGGALGVVTGGDFTSFAGGAAALRGGGKVLGHYVDRRVSQKVAELLTSSDISQVQKGIALIAQKPQLMRALRAADDRLGRVAGAQSSGVPALQSMGTGRAENDQPNVPGP